MCQRLTCAVRTVSSDPLRMLSISTVVHLSLLCRLQPKQISPLADASFPWFERRFLFHFNTTKQDRLELCHSELASVSVTIQIRSFPLLLYECEYSRFKEKDVFLAGSKAGIKFLPYKVQHSNPA